MKHTCGNYKIFVGPNSREIQEILFKLGYSWGWNNSKTIDSLDTPYLILYSDGSVSMTSFNNSFYKKVNHEEITLETLKNWYNDSINIDAKDLIPGEFYVRTASYTYGDTIFQFKCIESSLIKRTYSLNLDSDVLYNHTSGYISHLALTETTTMRLATPEEKQILVDRVNRETGLVLNPINNTFESPKPVFNPFDRVIGRDDNTEMWCCDFFSHMTEEGQYECTGGYYNQCLPYKGNEHLVGTSNSPKIIIMDTQELQSLDAICKYLIENEYISLMEDLMYDGLSINILDTLENDNELLFNYCVEHNVTHIWIDAYRIYKYRNTTNNE